MEFTTKKLPASIGKWGMILTAVGAIMAGAAFAVDSHRAMFGYLWMYMFLLSIGVGSLALVALEYLVGANWSTPFRRVSEFLSAIVILLAVLVIPLLFGMHDLFHWTHADAVAADPILQGKEPYLNTPFFIARTGIMILIWVVFYFLFTKNSRKQDTTKDPALTKQNVKYSAAFAIFFILTISFAAIDWMMSLEPHWFSTMFGVYYFAGTLVAAISIAAYISVNLNEGGYFGFKVDYEKYYSFGTLMFAFNVFWTYIAFSQYMLIWYADIPEETFWIMNRMEGTWVYFSIGLIFIHFIIPFLILLPRSAKTNPKLIMFMAMWLIYAHAYDLYWIIMPTHFKDGFVFSWNELGFLILAFGIIALVFNYMASKFNIVPVGDPKLERGLYFHLN
jgi:hypothetical protein